MVKYIIGGGNFYAKRYGVQVNKIGQDLVGKVFGEKIYLKNTSEKGG
jgi:hypothetical protein